MTCSSTVGSIQISHVAKTFTSGNVRKEILGDIDFCIRNREFVCIMGSSGCGKSTLIRIMEGIEYPDSGSVIINGRQLPPSPEKAIQRDIGIVFQNDNLLDWKNTYKNVELPLEVFDMKNEINVRDRVMYVLGLVGLEKFTDCLLHELSGGMRQRCAIARALVSDPPYLMFDQPFGALDAITRKILNVELLKLWAKTKKTCVMITNSVNEALYLGNRILFMSPSPSKIVEEIDVPFSYEERIQGLDVNPEYLDLRSKLNHIVRNVK